MNWKQSALHVGAVVWAAIGLYVMAWYGCWALVYYAAGPLALKAIRDASWWLRCRSYRRLVDRLSVEDDELSVAA